MPLMIEEDNMDDLYREVVHAVGRKYDIETSPRGMRTRECLAATLTLRNPRARIISSPARSVNYAFAAAEFLWYWQGREDLEYLLPYNKRLASFSNDGKTVGSAYGHRIFSTKQWRNVADELVRDPDSRRAVLRIFDPKDLWEGNKDVPCTLGLQFFIRDRQLHCHATMRSNDVFWGLPYDVFSFTLLQEMMFVALRDEGVVDDLGKYYHTAASLHIYERHFGKVDEILLEDHFVADPMAPVSGLLEMWKVVDLEAMYRAKIDFADLVTPLQPGTGEKFLDDHIRYKWQGGFIRPLRPANPGVASFGKLIACEDSDP